MRILYVGRYPPSIGGIEKHTYEILERLKEKNMVFLFTYWSPGEKIFSRNKNLSVLRLVPWSPGLFSQGLFSAVVFILLAFFILFFDVVNVSWSTTTAHFSLYRVIFRKPFVFTCHGIQGPRSMESRFFKKTFCFLFNLADCVICGSKKTSRDLFYLGVASGKLKVIPNGVNLREFGAVKVMGRKKQFVFFGRLAHEKGVDVLLNAFSMFVKKNPGYKLLIIGDGPEKPSLIELSKQLGVSHLIVFTGCLTGARLIEKLKESVAIVLPSRREEFHIAAIEALASGTPIIASKIECLQEIIADKVNGILAEPEKPQKLCELMQFVANSHNKEKIRRMTNRGLATAREYDWNKIAEEHERNYHEILNDL